MRHKMGLMSRSHSQWNMQPMYVDPARAYALAYTSPDDYQRYSQQQYGVNMNTAHYSMPNSSNFVGYGHAPGMPVEYAGDAAAQQTASAYYVPSSNGSGVGGWMYPYMSMAPMDAYHATANNSSPPREGQQPSAYYNGNTHSAGSDAPMSVAIPIPVPVTHAGSNRHYSYAVTYNGHSPSATPQHSRSSTELPASVSSSYNNIGVGNGRGGTVYYPQSNHTPSSTPSSQPSISPTVAETSHGHGQGVVSSDSVKHGTPEQTISISPPSSDQSVGHMPPLMPASSTARHAHHHSHVPASTMPLGMQETHAPGSVHPMQYYYSPSPPSVNMHMPYWISPPASASSQVTGQHQHQHQHQHHHVNPSRSSMHQKQQPSSTSQVTAHSMPAMHGPSGDAWQPQQAQHGSTVAYSQHNMVPKYVHMPHAQQSGLSSTEKAFSPSGHVRGE
jgi:hypothetical protein